MGNLSRNHLDKSLKEKHTGKAKIEDDDLEKIKENEIL